MSRQSGPGALLHRLFPIWQLSKIDLGVVGDLNESEFCTMAKKHKEKEKDQVPNPNNVSNRDIIQRLNFLYQASVYLNSVGPQPTSNHASKTDMTNNVKEEHKKRRRVVVVSTTDLSRSYIKSMKIVGQKTTVKMYAPLYLCCFDLVAAWTN